MNTTNLTDIANREQDMHEMHIQFLQSFFLELTLTFLIILGVGLALIGYVYACTNPAKVPRVFRHIFAKLRDIGSCYKQFPNSEDIETSLLTDIANEEGSVQGIDTPQQKCSGNHGENNAIMECSL